MTPWLSAPLSFNRSQSRRQKILEGGGCRGRRRVVKIQPTCACGFLCGSSFQHLGLPGIPASHTCYRGRAQGRAPLTPGAGPACPSGSLLPPRDGCFHVLTRGRGERHIPGYPTALHHHRDCPQLKRPDWAGVGGCIVSSVITQYPKSPGGIMVKNCQVQEDHTRIFPNPRLSL